MHVEFPGIASNLYYPICVLLPLTEVTLSFTEQFLSIWKPSQTPVSSTWGCPVAAACASPMAEQVKIAPQLSTNNGRTWLFRSQWGNSEIHSEHTLIRAQRNWASIVCSDTYKGTLYWVSSLPCITSLSCSLELPSKLSTCTPILILACAFEGTQIKSGLIKPWDYAWKYMVLYSFFLGENMELLSDPQKFSPPSQKGKNPCSLFHRGEQIFLSLLIWSLPVWETKRNKVDIWTCWQMGMVGARTAEIEAPMGEDRTERHLHIALKYHVQG